MGPPKFFGVSVPACHSLWTPADLHILAIDGCLVLASGTLKPWPSATNSISKLYQLSGHAVAPTAYRILCVRFVHFVHHFHFLGSSADATLDAGGWLALARPGLSPGKMRQAFLGAITFEFTRSRKRAKPAVASRVQRRVSPRLAKRERGREPTHA
jgi:hypothetical protein